MTEEEIRKLVTEEVGKAVSGLGAKLDEIKEALPAPAGDPADPDPAESKDPDPEPETPAAPEKTAPDAEGEKVDGKSDELKTDPGIGEKLDDIQERLKNLEAGKSRAAAGQDDLPEEKKEKWGGVLDSAFPGPPR